jgi:hypothetical protein
MVQRHIREGEAHVQRQHEIVAETRKRGAAHDMAIAVLQQFEDTLRLHKEHLVRIEARDNAARA